MQLIPINGHKLSSRELRRRLNAEAAFVTEQVAPSVNAALQNEQVTRQRVERLEGWAAVAEGILTRGFLGRLRWLVTGR